MFIPPGEPIHESLATSYVLVDSLVDDLCEGGFSGVVEVLLRDTDSFVVIANGNVSAAVETPSGKTNSGLNNAYTRTTVDQLAERSRRERGRVSIYGYSVSTANAVAGRLNAHPLYVGLSTEFTDLEKMISKLVRERDREWFIDVNSESRPGALIHMRDNQCRIIGAAGFSDTGALDLASNPALGYLIDECNRSGGTFDVYFTQATNAADLPQREVSQRAPVSAPVIDALLKPDDFEEHPDSLQDAPAPPEPDESAADAGQEPVPRLEDAGESGYERLEQPEVSGTALAAVAGTQTSFAPAAEPVVPDLNDDSMEARAQNLTLVSEDLLPPAGADAEAMAEIKRLMGEIARAIEEAAQSVGRPDSFAMSLRAGQLEIADRFPFLDPFAGEFEYLTGEIVFVGRANADDFVVGLTEALKLAIESVKRATSYGDRFCSYVSEDLQKLLVREREELKRFELEEVIQQLIAFSNLLRS